MYTSYQKGLTVNQKKYLLWFSNGKRGFTNGTDYPTEKCGSQNPYSDVAKCVGPTAFIDWSVEE